MRLDHFDLNLLLALNALLEEESVTRAAERMHLTQSAMSAALRRLRNALNDPLLVPHGRKMIATPHAREMAPLVAQALTGLRALLSGATAFDPALSDRRFDIAASDFVTTVLIAPLMAQLRQEAPHIRLNMSLPTRESVSHLADGKLDFLLTPEQFLHVDHPRELLFEERHVVVGWDRNPVLEGEMTREQFLAASHVSVRITGLPAFVDAYLQEIGDERRIEVIAPSFSLVPWMLPGTHHLALMHERLAKTFVPLLPLKMVASPIELPRMREMVQFHEARTHDAGLQWLLAKMLAAARE